MMDTDKILGCLIGGMVGDAAGAVLEFKLHVSVKNVERAMAMPGGGPHRVASGQVTDDSELDLALLHALALDIESTNSKKIIEAIAKRYIAWHESDPFDCGQTTRRAFGFAKDAKDCVSNALKYNMHSQANGALMRIAPLAIWAHAKNVPDDLLLELASADAQLSHPNPNCIDANKAFVIAIVHLLRNPGDSEGAIAAARNIGQDVPTWISDAVNKGDSDEIKTNCLFHVGHVKHAIVLAFHFLKRQIDYKTALETTLLQGGDTDTNAKIVSNLMGAFHGIKIMNHNPVIKKAIGCVMDFDCVAYNAKNYKIGINRPNVCCPSNVYRLVDVLKGV